MLKKLRWVVVQKYNNLSTICEYNLVQNCNKMSIFTQDLTSTQNNTCRAIQGTYYIMIFSDEPSQDQIQNKVQKVQKAIFGSIFLKYNVTQILPISGEFNYLTFKLHNHLLPVLQLLLPISILQRVCSTNRPGPIWHLALLESYFIEVGTFKKVYSINSVTFFYKAVSCM